jgi:hypothetical protein
VSAPNLSTPRFLNHAAAGLGNASELAGLLRSGSRAATSARLDGFVDLLEAKRNWTQSAVADVGGFASGSKVERNKAWGAACLMGGAFLRGAAGLRRLEGKGAW